MVEIRPMELLGPDASWPPTGALRVAGPSGSAPDRGAWKVHPDPTSTPSEHAEWRSASGKEAGTLFGYVYEIVYVDEGGRRRLRGVLACFNAGSTQVRPHEDTIAASVDCQLRLMRTTGSLASPIHLLCGGPRFDARLWHHVQARVTTPDVEILASDGSAHRLWRIDDETDWTWLRTALMGRRAFVADGHHRLSAILRHGAGTGNGVGGNSPAKPSYALGFFTHSRDEALKVGAFHRVVRADAEIPDDLLKETLERDFRVSTMAVPSSNPWVFLGRKMRSHANASPPILVAFPSGSRSFWIMEPKRLQVPRALAPDKSAQWRATGVAFADVLILPRIARRFGFRLDADVSSVASTREAVALVREAKANLALFLPPVSRNAALALADRGELLPPKSTFFYPKPVPGLLEYHLDLEPRPDPVAVEAITA